MYDDIERNAYIFCSRNVNLLLNRFAAFISYVANIVKSSYIIEYCVVRLIEIKCADDYVKVLTYRLPKFTKKSLLNYYKHFLNWLNLVTTDV